MSANYDPTTKAGKVRLLVSDTDTGSPVFTDPEIQAFLDLEDGSVYAAAAAALRAIAGNEAQVLKVISSLDLKTDGAKTADALRKLAEHYDERAEDADGLDAGFLVAEQLETPFQRREFRRKQLERTGGI